RFSATTGTIFHNSKIGLRKWFIAIYLMSDAKKSVSSLQLARELDISNECCWHMCHRIREAMREDRSELFSGIIEIDDYYHGGNPRRGEKGIAGRGTDKTPIVGVRERSSGRIRTAKVLAVDSRSVLDVIDTWIDLERSGLQSDSWLGYRKVGK